MKYVISLLLLLLGATLQVPSAEAQVSREETLNRLERAIEAGKALCFALHGGDVYEWSPERRSMAKYRCLRWVYKFNCGWNRNPKPCTNFFKRFPNWAPKGVDPYVWPDRPIPSPVESLTPYEEFDDQEQILFEALGVIEESISESLDEEMLSE